MSSAGLMCRSRTRRFARKDLACCRFVCLGLRDCPQAEVTFSPAKHGGSEDDQPYECGAIVVSVGDPRCVAVRRGDRLLSINGASATVTGGWYRTLLRVLHGLSLSLVWFCCYTLTHNRPCSLGMAVHQAHRVRLRGDHAAGVAWESAATPAVHAVGRSDPVSRARQLPTVY